MHEIYSQVFNKWMKFGGVDSAPRQFTGRLTQEEMEGKDAGEIARMMATHQVDWDREDEEQWAVDFEGVAKAFLYVPTSTPYPSEANQLIQPTIAHPTTPPASATPPQKSNARPKSSAPSTTTSSTTTSVQSMNPPSSPPAVFATSPTTNSPPSAPPASPSPAPSTSHAPASSAASTPRSTRAAKAGSTPSPRP